VQLPVFEVYMDALEHWLDGTSTQLWSGGDALAELRIFEDPEANFQEGWLLCDAGAHDRGLERLQRAVAKGYSVAPTLARSPAFDALRGARTFRELLARAERERDEALRTFREAGGEGLLGR
jgi:hypothetical protein